MNALALVGSIASGRKRRAAAVKAQQGIKKLRLEDNRQDEDVDDPPRQPPTPFYKDSAPRSVAGMLVGW